MVLDLTKSILRDVRESVGLTSTTTDFDTDLIFNINVAISMLNQNGVGNLISIKDELTTWDDLKNPLQTEGNKFFSLIPMYVSLSTKMIFDPPPPSAVEYHKSHISDLLWRLKIAYEEPYTTTTTTTV